MNHFKIYFSLIEKAKFKEPERLILKKQKLLTLEKHHIIPRCINGDNSTENLVYLTPREHFISHHLLCHIYPDDHKLKFAFFAMCNQLNGDAKRDYKVSSKTYQIAKELFSIENSKLHKNKKLSKEHIEIIRKHCYINNPNKNGRNTGIRRSLETKRKISKSKRDNPERQRMFKGYYLTPFGKFPTPRHIVNFIEENHSIKISYFTAAIRCQKNFRIIKEQKPRGSQMLSSLEAIHPTISLENCIGKTFKDMGWGFQPLQ